MGLLSGGDCGYCTLVTSLQHIRLITQCVMPPFSYPGGSKSTHALPLVRPKVELAVISRRR
ncbi:hypothetical protein DSM25558_3235 [Agrobacterium sp. DSM 25558]|nr:hypothetical protein DSM25558_3235 [Agrobacterium sp. DSM 25558]